MEEGFKMKVLVYTGGLGNQLFCYAFTQYLRNKYPKVHIYGVYNRTKLNEHFGLEINRWFDVDLPKEKWYASLLAYCLYAVKKTTSWTGLLDLNQGDIVNPKAIVGWAFRPLEKYIPTTDWIHWKVKDNDLSEKNRTIVKEMLNSESIFLHVRRGDYLSPRYKQLFEGCCGIDYYQKAIAYIKEEVNNPKFFVFSDDIEWTKNNIPLDNPTYIDWNHNEDSPYDMYLMSHCKYAIIANSTFSYWGARLGNKKRIVTYPSKWFNPPEKVSDMFPQDWIKL